MSDALPDAVRDVIDYGSSVEVVVNSGTLTSSTQDAVLNSGTVNQAYIGGEIVQFITATLTAPKTYQLSGFVRGCRGTERLMATHGSNEPFVLLSHAASRTMGAERIGRHRQLHLQHARLWPG
jgi:hypothetical protein